MQVRTIQVRTMQVRGTVLHSINRRRQIICKQSLFLAFCWRDFLASALGALERPRLPHSRSRRGCGSSSCAPPRYPREGGASTGACARGSAAPRRRDGRRWPPPARSPCFSSWRSPRRIAVGSSSVPLTATRSRSSRRVGTGNRVNGRDHRPPLDSW